MKNTKVCILLASYNGEKYIEQQVESFINQTYDDWKLIIRDDGSSDNTMKILRYFSSRDDRIEVMCDDGENLGAFRNFYRLTEYANEQYDPDYVLYSDQDDFWFKDKIEILLHTIKTYEVETIDKPILVHSNYQLADQNLNPMSINNNRDNVDKMDKQTTFNNLIFQNNIYGCTTIVNRLLIKKVLEKYVICENYDYWIALNASWHGEIFYLNKILMFYRQHETNVSGSHLTRKPYYKKIFLIFSELKKGSTILLNNIIVFDYFRKINNARPFIIIDEKTQKIVVSKKIIRFCLRNRIKKNTIHETLFFYFCLFYVLLLRKAIN
jgi:rhamnosyltransferase